MTLSPSRRLLFSLIAVTLGLSVIEGLLALIGIRPESYLPDHYVGFEGSSPLFVEWLDEQGDPWMRTDTAKRPLFNDQRFLRNKPEGTFRIFALGGSTTYGRPYGDLTSFSGWMRSIADLGANGRSVEIINAGGISYASYRVARLMEELVDYEPDAFVIYTGHNEFLEERIYNKRPKVPARLDLIAGFARHLRSASLIKGWLEPLTETGQEEEKARALLKGEVDAKLDNTLGPESYTRDLLGQQMVIEHFAFNLHRMLQIADSVGAHVTFIEPASNLSGCSPFKSEFSSETSDQDRESWQGYYAQAKQAFQARDPERTFAMLNAAEAIDSMPASLHYAKGRALEATGKPDEAIKAYRRAIDEDVCPLRALSGILEQLRSVCREESVDLIPFEALQFSLAPSGIPGASDFLDHVHPTIESNRQLARMVLEKFAERQWLDLNLSHEVLEQSKQQVLAKLDRPSHALAMHNLSKLLGWAGKHDEAYRASQEALKLDAGLPAIQYQAGLSAFLIGASEEALDHYKQALELDPKHAEAHCNLGVLLEEQGQLKQARLHFQRALDLGKAEHRPRNQDNLARVEAALRVSERP